MKHVTLFIFVLSLLGTCLVPSLRAQEQSSTSDFDFTSYFKHEAEVLFPEAQELRRQLHRIPEPCYMEKETSAFAAAYLRKLGLEVTTGIGKYGVKAVLKGTAASTGTAPSRGQVIAIRADMDALPISERTGLPFTSKNPGTMHACGHDAHMTNVLIAAKILTGIKDKIPGTIVFIFQPCEEGAPLGQKSGAEAMIAGGVLENPRVNAILGLHVMPDIPAGSIGICPGPIMANVASFYITIFGKSSHGALPHEGVDAISCAAAAIMEFQTLISRTKDPLEPAVLTVGTIKGGVRLNVIAEKVEMEGTVRTFSFEVQDQIGMGIEKILKAQGIAYDTQYRYDFHKDSPYVKNDPELTNFLLPVFAKVLGKEHVQIVKPRTVAEDFAHYSHKIPGVYFFLGVGGDSALHTPTFAVDEAVFKVAPVLFAAAAVSYLTSNNR